MRIINDCRDSFRALSRNFLSASTPARPESPLSSYARQSAPRFSAPAFLFTVASVFGCELGHPIQRFEPGFPYLDASTDQPTMAQDQLKVDASVTDRVPAEVSLVESGVDASVTDHVPTEIGPVDAGVDASTDVSNDRPIDIGFGDVGQDVPRDMGVDVVDAGEIGISDVPRDVALDAGDVPIPVVLSPSSGMLFPPTRVIRSWMGGSSHYRVCESTSGATSISDPLCPGEVRVSTNYLVDDSLMGGLSTYWKVAGCNATFTDCTRFSAFSTFETSTTPTVFFRLDEGSGGVVNDTGSGTPARFSGTLNTSARWASGVVGNGVQFNGSDSRVSIGESEDIRFGSGNFTIMAWVQFNRTESHGQVILEKMTSTNGFELYANSTVGALTFYGVGCGGVATRGFTDGFWHHVAVTREASAIRLYLDGLEVGSRTCADDFNNVVPLSVGCNGDTCSEPASGIIDDLILLPRTAISSAAINNSRCAVALPAAARLSLPLAPRCP